MEREKELLEIKEKALKKEKNYVYIGDFTEEMKVKLLLKIFEKAPIVDDSIVDYDILNFFAKEFIKRDNISYWSGRRLDVSLNTDYILSTVFNNYTEVNTIEKLVEEVITECS